MYFYMLRATDISVLVSLKLTAGKVCETWATRLRITGDLILLKGPQG
jgi:hypothetical protein